MDGESYLRFVLALVLVLGLLAFAAFFLRRSGIGPKLGRGRRLSAVETLPLGPRHRLVLVRRDDVEHLILIGPQGDVVVESGIGANPAAPETRKYPGERPAPSEATARPFAKELEDRSGADTDTQYTTPTDERN